MQVIPSAIQRDKLTERLSQKRMCYYQRSRPHRPPETRVSPDMVLEAKRATMSPRTGRPRSCAKLTTQRSRNRVSKLVRFPSPAAKYDNQHSTEQSQTDMKQILAGLSNSLAEAQKRHKQQANFLSSELANIRNGLAINDANYSQRMSVMSSLSDELSQVRSDIRSVIQHFGSLTPMKDYYATSSHTASQKTRLVQHRHHNEYYQCQQP